MHPHTRDEGPTEADPTLQALPLPPSHRPIQRGALLVKRPKVISTHFSPSRLCTSDLPPQSPGNGPSRTTARYSAPGEGGHAASARGRICPGCCASWPCGGRWKAPACVQLGLDSQPIMVSSPPIYPSHGPLPQASTGADHWCGYGCMLPPKHLPVMWPPRSNT
jgi:hypothetical protein